MITVKLPNMNGDALDEHPSAKKIFANISLIYWEKWLIVKEGHGRVCQFKIHMQSLNKKCLDKQVTFGLSLFHLVESH